MIAVGEKSFGHTVIPENKLHPLLFGRTFSHRQIYFGEIVDHFDLLQLRVLQNIIVKIGIGMFPTFDLSLKPPTLSFNREGPPRPDWANGLDRIGHMEKCVDSEGHAWESFRFVLVIESTFCESTHTC